MTKPRKAEDPAGPPKRLRRFPRAIKQQAVALAETLGNSSAAARQLGVPNQRVSEWLIHPDNAELRLRIQGKRLEAALEIADELPDLLREALEATRRVARSAEAIGNGTQARELATAVGVLETICARVLSSGGSGRYGGNEQGGASGQQRAVLPPLEHNQEG